MIPRQRLLTHFNLCTVLTAVAVVAGASHAALPPNDDCADATIITTATYDELIDDLGQATTISCEATSACDSNIGHSIWYRFTPPADGSVSLSLVYIIGSGFSADPFLAVFEGCALPILGGCAQPDVITCSYLPPGPGTVTAISNLPVVAGQSILIKVGASEAEGDFEFRFRYHPYPANDDCGWGTVITPGYFVDVVDVYNATLTDCDGGNTGCFLAGGLDRSVWYQFFAPFDGTLHLRTTGSTYRVLLTAFANACPFFQQPSGNCFLPSELDCASGAENGGTQMDLPLTAGQVVKVRAAALNNAVSLMLHLQAAFAPVNDSCDSATVIPGAPFNPDPLLITGADAAQDEPQMGCDTDAINETHSVYYRFTPPTDGLASINTLGSNYDTLLSVHGGCGTIDPADGSYLLPAVLACHDDIGGLLGPTSMLADVPMTAGATYLIRIAGDGPVAPGSTLDFNFNFQSGAICRSDFAPMGGDGAVNVTDLLALLAAWGPCPAGHPADFAPAGGDGQVNVTDLLALLAAWGECP
jgi:hypothetical protein